jgi:hypothetical protein
VDALHPKLAIVDNRSDLNSMEEENSEQEISRAAYQLTVNKPFENSCSSGNQLTVNATHHDFLAIGPSSRLIGIYANWEDDELYPNYLNNYDHSCTPNSSVEEKFLAQNVYFYLNHLVYWILNEIGHFEENYYQKIVFKPVVYDKILNYIGEDSYGDLYIDFGRNENPNHGYHYAFNPDYVIMMGILVLLDKEYNYTTADREGVYWGFATTFTRIYWENFAEQFEDSTVIRDTMCTFGGRYQKSIINDPKPFSNSLSFEEQSNIWASTLFTIYNELGEEKFFELLLPTLKSIEGKVTQAKALIKLQDQMHLLLQEEKITSNDYCFIMDELHYRYSADSVTNSKLLPIEVDYFIKDAGEEICPVWPVLPDTNAACMDNDRGVEPNIESSTYHSSSIINCPPEDKDCSQHVNPLYKDELTENYVKVKVHQIYPCKELEGKLRVYAALPTTTQDWDTWGGNGPFYATLSCGEDIVIARRIGEEIELKDKMNYEYNDSTAVRTYTVPWIPFNPQDFECDNYYDGKKLTTNILATIDGVQDSLDTEVEDIVEINNNAAAKNLTILSGDNLNGSEDSDFYFLGVRAKDDTIGLNDKGLKSVNLKLKISELGLYKNKKEMLSKGNLELDLSEEILNAWSSKGVDSGYYFINQDTNVIRITSENFMMSELQLQAGKIYPISIKYTDDNKENSVIESDSIIQFAFEQFNVRGEFEGGQGYIVKSNYEPSTNLLQVNLDHQIIIYPNPNNGFFLIESESAFIESVSIYSSNSQNKVFENNRVNRSSCRINLSDAVAGFYFVKVHLKDGSVSIMKVIKI